MITLKASLNAVAGASPAVAMAAAGEVPFTRVPFGDLGRLPSAARRVLEIVLAELRDGRTTEITDREIARRGGFGRRCVQKGLFILQHIFEYLDRHRSCGRRTITLLINFATKKTTAAKPKTEAKPQRVAAQVVQAPPAPTAASEPKLSETERRAMLDAWRAQIGIGPKPANSQHQAEIEASRERQRVWAASLKPPEAKPRE